MNIVWMLIQAALSARCDRHAWTDEGDLALMHCEDCRHAAAERYCKLLKEDRR